MAKVKRRHVRWRIFPVIKLVGFAYVGVDPARETSIEFLHYGIQNVRRFVYISPTRRGVEKGNIQHMCVCLKLFRKESALLQLPTSDESP